MILLPPGVEIGVELNKLPFLDPDVGFDHLILLATVLYLIADVGIVGSVSISFCQESVSNDCLLLAFFILLSSNYEGRSTDCPAPHSSEPHRVPLSKRSFSFLFHSQGSQYRCYF